MLPMATAHFQSTGASFKLAILCHPEPLEIHSLMPLRYHFGAFFKASLLQEKLPATLHSWEVEVVSAHCISWELDHQLCNAISLRGAAEDPGEMSSRWKLGQ